MSTTLDLKWNSAKCVYDVVDENGAIVHTVATERGKQNKITKMQAYTKAMQYITDAKSGLIQVNSEQVEQVNSEQKEGETTETFDKSERARRTQLKRNQRHRKMVEELEEDEGVDLIGFLQDFLKLTKLCNPGPTRQTMQ